MASIHLGDDAYNGFTIIGSGGGGRAVAAAGDYDGDGFDDLVITSLEYGMRYGDVGRATVVFGGPGNPDGTIRQQLPTEGRQLFGASAAGAGDVNGDGFDDVVIGAPGGAAAVVYLGGGVGRFIISSTGRDELGTAVAGAGDVNGDGLDDLLIGAPYSAAAGIRSGSAYVLFGKQVMPAEVDVNALTAADGFAIRGADETWTGQALSSAGDFNGDGYGDILIGAKSSSAAYVIFGKAEGFETVDLESLPADAGFSIRSTGLLGRSVASAGDVNGDGLNDLLVGSQNGKDERTQVIFGTADAAGGYDVEELGAEDGFTLLGAGYLVASAGDVNADGYADLLIGTLYGDAYLVFGKAGGFGTIDVDDLDGRDGIVLNRAVASYGYSFASAGDLNDDGFDDIVIGSPGVDIEFEGGEGRSEILFGGAFMNIVAFEGDEGANVAAGAIRSDTLFGRAGNDILSGKGGDDHLAGGAHDDILHGGTGDDRIDGGDGIDTASYAGSRSAYIDLRVPVQGAHSGGADSLISIENLVGSDVGDTLIAAAGANRLEGAGGNDRLDGGAGDDVLDGGAGSDTASYQSASAGVRVALLAEGAQDSQGAGLDTLIGIENLTGSDFDDVLAGTAGNNVLAGGGGDDRLRGNEGDDILDGGEGIDTATYAEMTSGVAVNLAATRRQNTGGAGYDQLSFVENLTGTSFDDSLKGNSLRNELRGGDGNDRIDGGGGADRMLGGGGDDIFILNNRATVVAEEQGQGVDTVSSSAAHYKLSANLEILRLTGAALSGTGNDQDNLLFGNEFGNLLQGGAGADRIDGGGGGDDMRGGTGDDIYVVDHVEDVVTEAASAGIDRVRSRVDFQLGANVENLKLEGVARNGTGNVLANAIDGNALANLIDGGAGVDIMRGGGGDDLYMVDRGSDIAEEGAGAGTDTVRSSASYRLGANVENLELIGSAIAGTGNGSANRITGNAAANRLDGGAGADFMAGAGGDDLYRVDNLGDRIMEAAGDGYDSVKASASHTLGANVESLVLNGPGSIDGTGNGLDNEITGSAGDNKLSGGDGNDSLSSLGGDDNLLGGDGSDLLDGGTGYDRLSGDAGNDQTHGGSGNDSLTGGSGNDQLHGGADRDRLTGGTGFDQFFFDTALNAATNIDTITDFVSADDTIKLDRAVFDAIEADGTLSSAAFRAGSAAADADDRIVYDQATGSIFYDADGSGAGEAVLFAEVAAGTILNRSDFFAYSNQGAQAAAEPAALKSESVAAPVTAYQLSMDTWQPLDGAVQLV